MKLLTVTLTLLKGTCMSYKNKKLSTYKVLQVQNYMNMCMKMVLEFHPKMCYSKHGAELDQGCTGHTEEVLSVCGVRMSE